MNRWPKRCNRCHRAYTRAQWAKLPPAGTGDGRQWFGDDHLEFRQCPCGSTLTIYVEPPGVAATLTTIGRMQRGTVLQ